MKPQFDINEKNKEFEKCLSWNEKKVKKNFLVLRVKLKLMIKKIKICL